MSTINTIRARIKAISIPEESEIAILKTKGVVEDLNRDRMNKGKRADGSIMPFYSQRSVNEFGKTPGPIKLLDTGSFQAKIFVHVDSTSIITDSSDSKSEMLQTNYGEAIFGLDKEGKKEYVQELRPVFVKQVRSKLML